jgi:uncharacterized protein YdhG (YjbR/CyaY superfamily)
MRDQERQDERRLKLRDPKSVGEYIAGQPQAVQGALACLRAAICNALPEAEEGISYRMPSYKLGGAVVLHFAGWKKHCSLYFASDGVVAAFGDEFAPYAVKKGTIIFPLSQPVPVKLIERIAKFRAKEIAAHR